MTLKPAEIVKTLKSKLLTRKALVVFLLIFAFAGSAGFWGYLGVNYYQARIAEQQAREKAAREFLASLPDQPLPVEYEQLTKEEIIDRYEPRFKDLENLARENLEDLFKEAMAEYKTRREKGTLDRMRLANEYLQKGQKLEKTIDIAFETLLEEMKTEFSNNNYSTDETREVKEEIKEVYDEAKKEKKQELFTRVREKLGD